MQGTRRPHLPILAALVALATLVAGCGSSGDSSSDSTAAGAGSPTATSTTPEAPRGASARSCESTVADATQLHVTGIGCDVGRGVVATWANMPQCSQPSGASRFSCAVDDGYRCLGAATGSGIAVSCSRPGSSVAFIANRS